VRVGDVVISVADIEHWKAVFADGGGRLGSVGGGGREGPQLALGFLISSWSVIGQAAELNAGPSASAVAQALRDKERSLPGGTREFVEILAVRGETRTDAALQLRARLALEALHRVLAALAPPHTSERDVPAFYREHRKRFALPEVREVDLVERLASASAANRLKARLSAGLASSRLSLHERLTERAGLAAGGYNARLSRAIFQAPLQVLMGPERLASGYVLFRVTGIQRERQLSFPQVHLAAGRQLTALLLDRERAQLVAQWGAHWKLKTACATGYVVSGCRGFEGRSRNPFQMAWP
jgi:hypothetical protein